MFFVWITEQTAIISLYSINWLVFVTETECVYCAVRTGSLYILQVNLYFNGWSTESGCCSHSRNATSCPASWSLTAMQTYIHTCILRALTKFPLFTTAHMYKTSGIPGSVKHILPYISEPTLHAQAIQSRGLSEGWPLISKPLVPALCFAVSSLANIFILILLNDLHLRPGRVSSSLLQVWLRIAVSTECRRPW